ncbi:MAG: SAM-dependent DNA methyltransferase [Gammaproteobacteria bacterium]|nr:SAM-dependent DNA methyltransferase [Gammaproteobacteria bacterium]MDE0508849.1 SAM-dependent DNA methyltransferase [Gammaproteobacteria bacterium]MYA67622.1 SAM-dependent DNA methyltransferase [Gammaproteobacteria bacterium]MYH46921.1 SAM-dependent DNA methyltransferase [Gammaproteobacteria bacterium]MYL12541.1 SAM-dependent DNA methyltransferase [Gammaproteobacteria bacterium]
MGKKVTELETRRLELQDRLDAEKGTLERNRMGQFATPTKLAVEMLGYARTILGPDATVRFLDPALGTGSFYSALCANFPATNIHSAAGFEIDRHYGVPAAELWSETGLEVRLEDFTRSAEPEGSEKSNLLICNPPYVRHHHIDSGDKRRLQLRVREVCGAEISGLAGLYCYFLGLSHNWMTGGGLAGWLIPSEFMDVNYGKSVKRYLLDEVTLLHIHRFDPMDAQFRDALVSSAVVWIKNEPPPDEHRVRFTYGGTLDAPKMEKSVSSETLRRESKWARYPAKDEAEVIKGPILSDFFKIKRGLATGNNGFFILTAREIEQKRLPLEAFKPILPSPRYLLGDEIRGDRDGNPLLDTRLFLLDPPWTEAEIEKDHPKLWAYLEQGKKTGIAARYICRHRAPWYRQERRPPAPFVCTYLGRGDKKSGRPFRFILNDSRATAANVYLMLYPQEPIARIMQDRPELKRRVWEYLNEICPRAMLGESRVYGGGLHKLEPKELGNVPAAAIAELLPEADRPRGANQIELF